MSTLEKPDCTSKNLLLHLDTVGITQNCVIVRVCMQYFEGLSLKSKLELYINPLDQLNYGLESNIDSISWWKQPKNYQKYVKAFKGHNVEDALDFIDWFVQKDVLVFCSAIYDYPVLKNLYEKAYRSCPIQSCNVIDVDSLSFSSKINVEEVLKNMDLFLKS